MKYSRIQTRALAGMLVGVLTLGVVAATAWAAPETLDRNAALHALARSSVRAQVFDHMALRQEALRQVPNEVVYRLKGDDQPFRVQKVTDVAQAVRDLARNPAVEYAEPNVIASIQSVPNDPYYVLQWHLDNPTYGGVGAEEAWDMNAGEGVTIALLDTGVVYEDYTEGTWFRRTSYYRAPDLAKTCFVPGYDFVNNDTHPNDDNSHGTHVAGTLAQTTGNGVGVAGLAYHACIMPLKVMDAAGYGSHTAIAQAIYYAVDHGAQVISMSLGSSEGTQTLLDALAYAYEMGVTVVAASGNNNGAVSYPAAYDAYVIAVGATGFDEARAGYSNYGASVDLVAPGGDLSVDRNGDGYADDVLQQTFDPNTKVRNDWGYYFFQGTSMATPHVAAAAAMVLAQGFATTPDDVRQALESTADDLGASGRDDLYGYGMLDVPGALAWTPGPVDARPSVTVHEPGEGAVVQGVVDVAATATDDGAVATVTLADGDTVYPMEYSDSDARYHVLWESGAVGDGPRTLTVRATDSVGQAAEATVSVVVDNVNAVPLADAGADQVHEVLPGGAVSVALTGTATDPDPDDVLTYAWYQLGADAVQVADTAVYATTLGIGDWIYMLEARDQRGGVATDTVMVSVQEQVVPDIALSVFGYRVFNRSRADLSWTGAQGTSVDVYRNGKRVTTTGNDGFYTDRINVRTVATYTYRICEQGSVTVCSPDVAVRI